MVLNGDSGMRENFIWGFIYATRISVQSQILALFESVDERFCYFRVQQDYCSFLQCQADFRHSTTLHFFKRLQWSISIRFYRFLRSNAVIFSISYEFFVFKLYSNVSIAYLNLGWCRTFRYFSSQSYLDTGMATNCGFYIFSMSYSLQNESRLLDWKPCRQKKDMVEQSILTSSVLTNYCRTLKASCFQLLGDLKYMAPMKRMEAPMLPATNIFQKRVIDMFFIMPCYKFYGIRKVGWVQMIQFRFGIMFSLDLGLYRQQEFINDSKQFQKSNLILQQQFKRTRYKYKHCQTANNPFRKRCSALTHLPQRQSSCVHSCTPSPNTSSRYQLRHDNNPNISSCPSALPHCTLWSTTCATRNPLCSRKCCSSSSPVSYTSLKRTFVSPRTGVLRLDCKMPRRSQDGLISCGRSMSGFQSLSVRKCSATWQFLGRQEQDRFYLPGTQEQSLYKVGMTVFKTKVLHQHNTQFFMNCYFAILRQLRHSKVIQSYELLHFSEAISIIDSKSLISQLTKRFIEQSCDYYNSFFRLNSSKLSPVQYLSTISNLHKFEFVLIKMTACLNFFEQAELSAHFQSILVRNYTEQLVKEKTRQGGLWELFEKKHIEGMKVVNQVYGRFQGFQKIKHAYYQILLQQGSTLPSHQSSIVPIYEFYKSHLSILTSGFSKRNQLLVTLNNAIENIISRQEHFPTKLYQYCSSSRANQQFQKEREMITVLFQKISMKDQFIDRYEDELIKKISDATVNIDEEDQFVQWLNSICGNELTHRLGKKIKDYRQAPKSIELGQMLPQNTLFKISVLSLHLWEKKFVDQLSLNISLPQTLQAVWSRVEKNFTAIEPKKKLTILPFSSKLTLSVRFNLKTYTIKCHLIQASVLIYLSSKAYSSQQELIQSLMIEKNLLQSTLQSLQSIPNLLIKTTLNDYLINWYFDHPQNTIDLISKTPQSRQISKAIQQDRQILLEAAIVKFMKRKKTGTFQDIANAVVSMIKLFKPLPPAIKATIQRLVKKSYLEDGENGILVYSE